MVSRSMLARRWERNWEAASSVTVIIPVRLIVQAGLSVRVCNRVRKPFKVDVC